MSEFTVQPQYSNNLISLALGTSDVSLETCTFTCYLDSLIFIDRFRKAALSTWSSTDTKQLNSVKEAPCTGSSFSLALSKALLQDRLTDLKDLIRSEDGQSASQDIRNLVFRVIFEIESWLNRGEGAMTFEAQISLSNMACNGPTKNNICDQFSCKNDKYFLASYLFLFRSATNNNALSDEKRQMLSNLLYESEEFIKEPENAMTDKVHRDELNLLHDICDGDIAIHSIDLAIIQILANTLLPLDLRGKATGLLGHYDNLGRISDLEKVIARQREAIIFTPLKSADRPLMLTILGDSYRSRYERFRDVKDIDSAIRQQSIALASIPRDSPHRPAILLNFGVAYLRRLERVAERKHFDFPINRMLDAVTSITTASSGSLKNVERLGLLRTLGNFYLLRFKLFGDINDLDPAIEQLQKAASIPLDIPDPSIHKILGNSYCTRFVWFSAIKDIESAIEQLLKAAASVPRNSILYPDIMHSLGNSYRCRFEWFGNKPDLESAMKHLHEAAASIPLIDPDRPRFLNDLASSYHCRFVRFGRKEDIDSAIKQQLELIASIIPPDNPERANFLMFSGSCYLKRFEHFGEANDLDSAINQNLKAFKLASTLPNSPQDVFLHELGVSYQHRFRHSGHVKDIDSAIDLILKAVASTPLDNPKRPGYLASLGISYSERFKRFGEVKDIDLAIKQHLEAVGCTSTSLANRVAVHNNMALSHLMRFNHYGEKKDVDLSTKLVLEAAPSTPLDSPLRPKLAEKLGMSYAHRFTHSGDVKDSDLAIKEMLEAVASASPAYRLGCINNLGTIYLYRFQFFNEVKDIDVAIEIFVEALAAAPPDSPDRTSSLNNLGVSYLFRYRSNHEPSDLEKSIANFHLSSLSHGMPSMRIRGSLEWARLSHQFDDLVSASQGYDQAIRLLPRVAWIGLNAIAQLKELSSDIQMLGCNAAACMIALAEAATEHHNRQHHLGRAIELLDQGRSILWSQTSNFKRDLEDLRKVDRDLANDLDNVGKFLAQSCFRDPNDPLSETDAQLYRRNAEKWESLVHRIRGLPDFHQFLLPSPISILRTAAAEGPVVIINSSEYRCDAVIIPSQLEGDLVLVPLPNITAEELKSLTNQQEELASRKSKSVWIQSQDYSMPSETLEEVLNQTWLLIGEPIVEQLGLLRGSKGSSKSRVWWCLTGSLSFLPIHASCPPTKPGIGMMDIVISSYTPTVSTLLRARQRNKLKRPTLRMLAVGQSNIAGMTPLPGVTEEIAFIKKNLVRRL